MKNIKYLTIRVIYLSGIIFAALLFIQIKYTSCYANDVHNKQTKSVDRDPKRLWCKEHSVYEDECFICHPELKSDSSEVPTESVDRDPKRLWCNEHSVYEDECLLCRPESGAKAEGTGQDTKQLWCKEHSVYEDECFICHPELKSDSSEVPPVDLYCEEHRVLERECGICRPEMSNELNFGQGLKIRLKSTESAVKAGIITSILSEGESIPGHTVLSRGGSMPGFTVLSRVTYNQNRFAHITSLASGVVQKVLVDAGAFVSEGEVLVEIASPGVAGIKAEYLTALTNEKLKKLVFEREERLFNKKVSSQHEYQQARAEYEIAGNNTNTAHQQLLNFGLSEDELKYIEETQTSASTLHIRASFSGTIVERHAVVGEFVKPGDVIFSLVDLSTMWLELSIPENLISFFKFGNKIEASFKEYNIEKMQGLITWLASNIDEESRMMKGRAVVKNTDSFLKHGMFGEVRLLSQNYSKKFNVPVKSIQRLDGKDFVFIKLSNDLFEIRRVEAGESNKENVEILQGLSTLDELVVDGSFTLKSEFLKSRFGEGCAD